MIAVSLPEGSHTVDLLLKMGADVNIKSEPTSKQTSDGADHADILSKTSTGK